MRFSLIVDDVAGKMSIGKKVAFLSNAKAIFPFLSTPFLYECLAIFKLRRARIECEDAKSREKTARQKRALGSLRLRHQLTLWSFFFFFRTQKRKNAFFALPRRSYRICRVSGFVGFSPTFVDGIYGKYTASMSRTWLSDVSISSRSWVSDRSFFLAAYTKCE